MAFVAFGRFAGTFRPVHASEQQRRDAAEGEIVDEWTENRAGAALDEQVRRYTEWFGEWQRPVPVPVAAEDDAPAGTGPGAKVPRATGLRRLRMRFAG